MFVYNIIIYISGGFQNNASINLQKWLASLFQACKFTFKILLFDLVIVWQSVKNIVEWFNLPSIFQEKAQSFKKSFIFICRVVQRNVYDWDWSLNKPIIRIFFIFFFSIYIKTIFFINIFQILIGKEADLLLLYKLFDQLMSNKV